MTEPSVDNWIKSFYNMGKSRRTEALVALRDKINRDDDVVFKKEMSGFMNGIRIAKSNEKIIAGIEHHLKHVRDENDIVGYIDRRVAVKFGLILPDLKPQHWTSIMNSVIHRGNVAGLRVHDFPLPRAKEKGRKPKLYVSDSCDIELLFSARSRSFDPTNHEDAIQMVTIIKKFIDFSESEINLYDQFKKVEHPLFPDFTILNMRTAAHLWLSNYLIPDIGGIETWRLNNLFLRRR